LGRDDITVFVVDVKVGDLGGMGQPGCGCIIG